MNMLKALQEGDYEQMIGAHPDIIFFNNVVDYPYKQEDEPFPSYLSSFIDSDLYKYLEGAKVECLPLKNMRQSLIDLVDTAKDFYSSPIYIVDTRGQAFLIYDRDKKVYLDANDSDEDEERILQNLNSVKKDRSETVVIIWNIYQDK